MKDMELEMGKIKYGRIFELNLKDFFNNRISYYLLNICCLLGSGLRVLYIYIFLFSIRYSFGRWDVFFICKMRDYIL